MLAISTIGLDIAKSVFQVHGVDARGGLPLITIPGSKLGFLALPERAGNCCEQAGFCGARVG
jgi:transposase